MDGTEPGRILLQILHASRYVYHPLAVSASATRSPISPFAARALITAGVRAAVCDFDRCAVLARYPGYSGSRSWAARGVGYLINQLLVARMNQRNDE